MLFSSKVTLTSSLLRRMFDWRLVWRSVFLWSSEDHAEWHSNNSTWNFFLIYFKSCVPICVCGSAFECQCTYILDETVVFTGARVTGDWDALYGLWEFSLGVLEENFETLNHHSIHINNYCRNLNICGMLLESIFYYINPYLCSD